MLSTEILYLFKERESVKSTFACSFCLNCSYTRAYGFLFCVHVLIVVCMTHKLRIVRVVEEGGQR